MGDRCTGHCCRSFYLPHSPEVLAQKGEESKQLRLKREQEGGTSFPPSDVEFMHENAVYLGQGAPVRAPMRLHDPRLAHKTITGHFYTCKKFDQATHNCTAYDTRPTMCSAYPYGQACLYMGCTSDQALQGHGSNTVIWDAATGQRLNPPLEAECKAEEDVKWAG